MAGCDGWITIKAFELVLSVFCIIFKRVTDDEANKLFYFLQKISREWPLLNNITWEENGAIFTDVTYGGFVVITSGLILAQATGELNHARKLENFFLSLGALMFIAAGSLELAALDSVEERLVDNAAILGVVSLMTGLLFLVDLIMASKRRKKAALRALHKAGNDKTTQTEETKPKEIYSSPHMNGNLHQQSNGYHQPSFLKMDPKKVPTNGVKILPTSPVLDDNYHIPVTNSNNEFVGTIPAPQVFSAGELKTPQAKIRSTESFLRSEKGEIPQVRRRDVDSSAAQVVVPPGYVLVPAASAQRSEDSSPVGYAQVKVDKSPKLKTEYVMVPVEHLEVAKGKEGGRKLQSPTVTTTVRTSPGFNGLVYYPDNDTRQTPYPQHAYGHSNLSLSDADDQASRKINKYSPEYLQMNMQARKHSPMSDDSSELPKYFPTEHFPQYKTQEAQRPQEKWTYLPAGSTNRAYDDDEVDFVTPFKRNSSTRSSRIGQDKPKSILRFDQYRASTKKDNKHMDSDLGFPKEVNYNSLDSQKIADDLKQLKEITKSDLDLSRDLEKENQLLKAHLRKEKQEKEKLKQNFQIELQNKEEEARSIIQKTTDELEDRKNLESRISELEDLKRQMKLELRDAEERNRLEQKIRDLEDEKDRRMSERDEQYFGIADLRQSHKDSSPVGHTKLADLDTYFRREGAKDVNVKLKEKVLEMEDQGKDEDEPRKVIDDGFHFLHESEKKSKSMSVKKPEVSHKPKFIEKRSAPDLTNIYHKSIEAFKAKPQAATVSKSPTGSRKLRGETPSPGQRSDDSDETPYSQITDGTSYRSEAQFWLGSDKAASTPTSPRDPGYVLHTAQHWPEASPASPQDRFLFSSKKAQQINPEGSDSSKILDFVDFDEPKKSSHTSHLLDNEEMADPEPGKVEGRRRGLLIRKVDFAEEPDTIIRPASATGSTSTWKKWLQPKTKLHPTRSTPN